MLFGIIRSAAIRSAGSTERLSQSARGRSSRTGVMRGRHVLYAVSENVGGRTLYLLDNSKPVTWLDELRDVLRRHVSIDEVGTGVVCDVCHLGQPC